MSHVIKAGDDTVEGDIKTTGFKHQKKLIVHLFWKLRLLDVPGFFNF